MRIVKFRSSWSDEAIAPDSPPGRRLATEIRDELQASGGGCTEVDLHSEFGWAWVQIYQGVRFYLLVTQVDGKADSWTLSVEQPSLLGFLGLGKKATAELALSQGVQRLLSGRGDVTIIGWFDRREELSSLPQSAGRPNP
jgi:hypothetical protein